MAASLVVGFGGKLRGSAARIGRATRRPSGHAVRGASDAASSGPRRAGAVSTVQGVRVALDLRGWTTSADRLRPRELPDDLVVNLHRIGVEVEQAPARDVR